MKNKVKLSLTLSANDPAQMLALANFAKALAENQASETPQINKAVAFGLEGISQAPHSVSGARMATILTEAVESLEPAKNEAEAVVKEAPQRKRRTQAEIKAEREEAEQVSESETAESEPAVVEDEAPKSPAPSKITLDDVRRAIADKKEKHLQIMKFKLQEEFGVSKAPDLKPDQYEAYYNFLTSLD